MVNLGLWYVLSLHLCQMGESIILDESTGTEHAGTITSIESEGKAGALEPN